MHEERTAIRPTGLLKSIDIEVVTGNDLALLSFIENTDLIENTRRTTR